MDERNNDIRNSALNTLQFLASEDAQRDFASKVRYDSYQDEFACWWFDNFLPGAPNANECFSPAELAILVEFSSRFDQSLNSVGHGPASIDELLANESWRQVISSARQTQVALGLHAYEHEATRDRWSIHNGCLG